jgi:tetratricopeptide (TPR) repeat protein
MKSYLTETILAFALCASGAAAQSVTPAPNAAKSPDSSSLYSQQDQAKRGQAYTDFMLGTLAEKQFESSGKSEDAEQAINYYKQALTLDADPAITARLAEVYAESGSTADAIQTADGALQQDPDNLAAHRLLARIYVHELADATDNDTQKQTIASAVEQLQAVQRLDPSDVESQLWLARLYGFQNQPQKAEDQLRGILSRSPDSTGALEQLSQLYLEEGRPQDAISLLQNAAASSDDPTLYDLLGKAYSKTGDNAKAEAAFSRAVALDPDEATHRADLAKAMLDTNDYQGALEQYQKLSQMEPDNAENYLRISQIYRHMNQLDKSEAAILQAKKYATSDGGTDLLEVLYNEALLYEAQARYKDAIEVLSDAIAGVKAQHDSGQPVPSALSILYEQLGMAHRDAGDFASAERTFEDMKQLGPRSQKEGELLLIDTYRASGNIKQALAEAEKARAADSTDTQLSVEYATLLGDNSQVDEATKVLRSLNSNGQIDRDTYLELAQVEDHGKRYTDAVRDANSALDLSQDPADKESAWFLLGAIYNDAKNYDQAEQMFRKSLEVKPHDAEVLNDYGYMLVDRGIRLDEAISMIHSAVNEDPTNSAYLDSLGWAYFKQGNFPEAQQYLQQAISHDSTDPTILGHLGDVYAKMGQPDRAEQTWERALAWWQKAAPADYQPAKVNELENKLKNLKRHAQRSSDSESRF